MCDTVARTGCRVARSSCEDFGGAANLPEVGIVNVPILRRVWRRSIAFWPQKSILPPQVH